MDLAAVLGVILALVAILGGSLLGGGQLQEFVNLPAAAIVLGGTFAAAIIQSPRQDVSRSFKLLGWAFGQNKIEMDKGIDRLVSLCVVARRKGLLALEAEAEKESDVFLKNGLLFLSDGKTADDLRAILEVEMITNEQRDLQATRVIESMGGYAPTMGIIGSVVGLISVMGNLSDPKSLSVGIATAFVATIYGIGIANLFLIPVANKIKSLVLMRYQYQEMVLDGLMYIAQGHNPKAIRQRLQGYVR